ncbi:MAG: methylamine utilization protein [Xanthomonadaceae bacterium]|nr:methylamine utilization protein [Xanthomonadaceae bacterium]
MRTGARFIAAFVLLSPLWALAGELTVLIDDGHGHRVADAVVTMRSSDPGRAIASHSAVSRTIDQRDLAFVPYIEVFQPGDAVVFRNSDRTRHHVYSFSPAKQFEFVLAPGESSKPQRLEKTGVVAVGCNIHDQMIAYLFVSDAPWVARSGRDGRVDFKGLPPGAYVVDVWQPRMRPGRSPKSLTAVVADAGSRTLAWSLSLSPPTDYDNSGY